MENTELVPRTGAVKDNEAIIAVMSGNVASSDVVVTDSRLRAQLSLLHGLHGSAGAAEDQREDMAREARGCPIFSPILVPSTNDIGDGGAGVDDFCPAQYGLLAANTAIPYRDNGSDRMAGVQDVKDSRIFQNVAAPSSAFICGSQGSGKSHTLSCMLENCLLSSEQGCLPKPLAGVVFHYDTFTSDLSGMPCEAAYLASNPDIKVRVLCAPTNIATIKRTYAGIPGVTVEPLQLDEHDLNTQRMLDLMAAGDGGLPLYMHVVQRILRDMRVQQQQESLQLATAGVVGAPGRFNYAEFKRLIASENLQPQQSMCLYQRLDTLESFMVTEQTARRERLAQNMSTKGAVGMKKKINHVGNVRKPGTDWQLKAGQLTIVDLSCPCITQEQACSLFNICLSLALEQRRSDEGAPAVGKVIALDEAHKYMGEQSPECRTLTQSLLSTIRLQRHLGTRVIISTQEPTISPKLLDLCSVTIVHRFTSPDWLRMLSGHLAGISTAASVAIAMSKVDSDESTHDTAAVMHGDLGEGNGAAGQVGIQFQSSQGSPAAELFSYIVKLKVGEALMFAPSAILDKKGGGVGEKSCPEEFKVLGHEVLKIRIRKRLTADGGRSIMAA
ncbi:DNA double-strand break repair helicase HerA and related ATPase [Microdochium nivale]|nr:DNA double-strand break repair helicase HerA and related ATPase [Microdochium nivale]